MLFGIIAAGQPARIRDGLDVGVGTFQVSILVSWCVMQFREAND